MIISHPVITILTMFYPDGELNQDKVLLKCVYRFKKVSEKKPELIE